METIRSEFNRYCTGFTLAIGIVLLYRGIWSLNTSLMPGATLVSSMSPSLWLACTLFLAGAISSHKLVEISQMAAAWVLCLAVTAGLSFILWNVIPHPYGVILFLLPVLFSAFLFDWKQMAAFSGLITLCCIVFSVHHNGGAAFQSGMLLPTAIVLVISLFLLVIMNEMNANFEWYHKNYISVKKNEQIIQQNEVELKSLVKSMNNYQRHLNTMNELLIKAREDAERAKNVKQILVQNVSHELRTPLNLIIGFSDTMINAPQSYGEVNWTPDLKGDIECIYQNSQHLKALIDDVLDLAALENKKYDIEAVVVDLNAILRSAVQVNEVSYQTKGLYLKTELEDDLLMVQADSVRIKQVLLNLLSNALKYTRRGGVMVSARRLYHMARIEVRDTGIGIVENDIEKVFEAFYQVDKSTNREDSGTGLGLSISRQLIELHGGEMKIDSIPGSGTTVWFTLPLAE